MIRQRTIRRPISLTGIGAHTGETIELILRPAPEDTGIVFRRMDCPEVGDIAATAENVGDTRLASTLVKGAARISTIEHLMASLSGLGVDNLFVEVGGPEVPIMDGSAIGFVALIQSVGLEEQAAAKRLIRIKKAIEVECEQSWVRLLPFDGCKLSFTLKYDHPVLGKMPNHAEIDLSKHSFVQELSRGRTFWLLSVYEMLRALNLARGSSLDNVVVIDEDRVLNEGGLRYANECARHKLLDAVGDLYQLGYGIIGEFQAYRSGHALNNQLNRKLLSCSECWEIVDCEEDRNYGALAVQRFDVGGCVTNVLS